MDRILASDLDNINIISIYEARFSAGPWIFPGENIEVTGFLLFCSRPMYVVTMKI